MSDLKSFQGTAERGRPILELGPTGPYRGRVRVVPVKLTIGPRLEIVVDWYGPPLPGLPPTGRPAETQDVHQVAADKRELATGIAHAAHDLLQHGEIPFLRNIHVAMDRDGPGWRRRYDDAVGDAGKGATHGDVR